MALGKIDHIEVLVDDLEKAEEYFTKKLGFKLLRRIYEGKGLELTSPGGDFFLDLNLGGPGHFNHIAFKVDDINKEFEELKSKGVSFLEDAPFFNPGTGRTVADAADADGCVWLQLTS